MRPRGGQQIRQDVTRSFAHVFVCTGTIDEEISEDPTVLTTCTRDKHVFLRLELTLCKASNAP